MIEVGQAIPNIDVQILGEDGPQPVNTSELFANKKVVMFAVPGAFTPTCSAQHLPGFIKHAAAIKAKSVDLIVCLSVNDSFVMSAWAKASGVSQDIVMLADGSANFTRALGLDSDFSSFGMGTRSQRFALIADQGKVIDLAVEQAGAFDVSSAETVLSKL